MKKSTVHTGLWYIPGSETRYSGVLKTNSKKKTITLTIYSSSYIGGAEGSASDIRYRMDNPVIVLGGTTYPITLYNCRWSGTSPISDKINKINYSIGFVFEFAHFAKPEDIIVKSVNINFPCLTSWYDSWRSVMANEDELDTESLEIIDINSRFSLGFNNILLNNNSLVDKYRKHVSFIYKQNVDFDTALREWAEFASMLKLATSKDIGYEINWLNADREVALKPDKVYQYPGVGTEVRCAVRNFSLAWGISKDKRDWIHQNDMIFSAWKLPKEALCDVIRKWYDNKSFYPIYDYYIDSNKWPKGNEFSLSNVMFNNKFLNLMQGLEAYHFQLNEAYNADNHLFVAKRQKVLNSIDRELRLWVNDNLRFPKEHKLNDRLTSLLSRFEVPLRGLSLDLKYINHFPSEAKDLRHKLSHGNLNSTYQGERLHHLLHVAQLLLCMCILESLGLDEYGIMNSLRNNTQMERIAYEIVHYYRLKGSND